MNEHTKEEIKRLLLETQHIVDASEINQEFKQVAFHEVFRALFKADSIRSTSSLSPAGAREKTYFPQKKTRDVKQSSKSTNNPARLIDELIEKNFFLEKRKDTDCMAELSVAKGIKIPRNQMATVLVRKLRTGLLKREKSENGYIYFTE